MGELTPEAVTACANLVIVAVLLHFHVKGAFCTGLFIGTFIWWLISQEWPEAFVTSPFFLADVGITSHKWIILLIFNMFFLYVLTLNGLGRALSDLAHLTKPNGAIPRGNFLFIVTGLTTMLAGYLSGPPILISPESAAGIKAGAKTGLSTLVCGVMFGVSIFFAPVFAAVPAAGTGPLLIMVGVMMFGNCKRVDWQDYKIAVPAYCVLFFIPFTYSILRGVAFGYVIYILIGLFTGDMIENFAVFYHSMQEPWFQKKNKPLSIQMKDDAHGDYNVDDDVNDLDKQPEHDEYDEKIKATFIGRTLLRIQTVMDAQEMHTGDIANITQI